METEQKAPLQCFRCQPTDTNVFDGVASILIPSSSENVVPLHPAKRPTRQWAAWTREEEESFFTALRQVGKNFEKITCRVQSKNKDQVRHYYYRLVRRMNKLLGPGLYLDAKNSKDTNAAMLRWWSLLEKYSCKASKLHLKPRRFKIFLEALEHQLLKDRKKSVRQRSPHGEKISSPSPTSFPNQNNSTADDVRAVKVVLGDSQNIKKGGQGKGSSTRRNLYMGVSRSSNKGESSLTKSTRERRKSGVISAAAIKRWEKAAIAGVSMVADAAEHLEHATGESEAVRHGRLTLLPVQAVGCSVETDSSPSLQVNSNLLNLSKSISITVDNNVQTATKLKLQLFPIDESTRKALEAEKRNPHLELTLGARKKISSILEHLDHKWGSSSAAFGELMLFPFTIQRENLSRYQRWTRDSVVTAADVHTMTGSPSVFRLRYGWILSDDRHAIMPETLSLAEGKNKLEEHISLISSDHQTLESADTCVKQSTTGAHGVDPHIIVLESSDVAASMWSKRNQTFDVFTSRKLDTEIDKGIRNTSTSSAGEWADSVKNVSVGDLLTDVSDSSDANCVVTPVLGTSQCHGEIPLNCDSFDAAIAAHLSTPKKTGFSGLSLHSSSIWDAEETCDAFSFQSRAVANKQSPSSSMTAATTACEGTGRGCSGGFGSNAQLHGEAKAADAEKPGQEEPMVECPSEPHESGNSAIDFGCLTDICWPDSLGPLELDVPSCKYYSADLIISDSLSGLNRLIASSLDAFQNFSFFGLDEKSPSATEVHGSASFAGKLDTTGVYSLQA